MKNNSKNIINGNVTIIEVFGRGCLKKLKNNGKIIFSKFLDILFLKFQFSDIPVYYMN